MVNIIVWLLVGAAGGWIVSRLIEQRDGLFPNLAARERASSQIGLPARDSDDSRKIRLLADPQQPDVLGRALRRPSPGNQPTAAQLLDRPAPPNSLPLPRRAGLFLPAVELSRLTRSAISVRGSHLPDQDNELPLSTSRERAPLGLTDWNAMADRTVLSKVPPLSQDASARRL